ncbi:MAG: hypothetical protein ON057_001374 [Glomeribacter sp. 1016415]|nr:hypothetical protein [Glomeribacter sp. 1016415]
MIESKVMKSQEEWLTHVSKWRESGLSQAAYIRANGLKKSSLSRWIHHPCTGGAIARLRRFGNNCFARRLWQTAPCNDYLI